MNTEKEGLLTDHWKHWPKWIDDETFHTPHFQFHGTLKDYTCSTGKQSVAVLKNKGMLDIYCELLGDLRPKKIFEIGFFQGGMPLFLAEMIHPEKIVAIDINQQTKELVNLIQESGLDETIKLYGGIAQDNTTAIHSLLKDEFGKESIDLIIDDASHEYMNSRCCFEETFGYLRPGGKYVLEDWGWLHWKHHPWQSDESYFWGKPALTNLLFELTMGLASSPEVIARVDILNPACAVITRGDGLAHGEKFDLTNNRKTCGREFGIL
jgi:SAM-dependent methyltransferase